MILVRAVSTTLLSRFRLSRSARFALLGALVLALPPLLLGPWLPFVDLTAFVGMSSYPTQLSYGPFHYYIFQFSYIGHYALCRFLSALHLPVSSQVVVLYLLQAGVCFAVICRLMERMVENVWLRCLGISLGALACWDAQFIWGGPLAFSLAAMNLTIAMYFTLREAAEPAARSTGWVVGLFGFAGLVCHPFALPFAMALCALRVLLLAGRRLENTGMAAALALFGWVIIKDSPAGESFSASRLSELIGLNAPEMGDRLVGLFTQDAQAAQFLFGFAPTGLGLYFVMLGVVHCIGFCTAPFVACYARESRPLRMLALLTTGVAVLYFIGRDVPAAPIPQWPQRILTFYSPFTFLAGIVGPAYLIRRFWPPRLRVGDRWGKVGWIVPLAILGCLALVQLPVFRLGENIRKSYEATRAEILRSPVKNAFLVVSNVDSIRPFYLRCIPFLLFSDPEIVARRITIFTEWHFQPRHPTRLTEDTFNLGRARYLANFSVHRGLLEVKIMPHAADTFPVAEHTRAAGFGENANLAGKQFQQGIDLFQAGANRDAYEHFLTAVRLLPTYAEAHNNLGVILLDVGRGAEAMERFVLAVRIKPDFAEGRSNLGALLLDQGRPAEAIEHLEAAVRLSPNAPGPPALLAKARAAVAK